MNVQKLEKIIAKKVMNTNAILLIKCIKEVIDRQS